MSDLPDIDGYRKMNVPFGSTFKRELNTGAWFSKMCQITTKYNGGDMDLLDLLGDISKPARDLFLVIKCNMNFKTNEALIEPVSSKYESARRSKSLSELKSRCLAKRITGNLFMVNPSMIIPPSNEQRENAEEKWENIG